MLAGLLAQIAATDPEMLAELGGGDRLDIPTLVGTWSRLVSRTTPQRRLAVLAGSRRQRRRLETAGLRAGWLVVGGSADEDDPVALARLILSTETTAVLLGADNSPGGDEKRHLPDLAALVAAATVSRPDLTVVLAGGAAAFEAAFVTQAYRQFPEAPPIGPADEDSVAEPSADSSEVYVDGTDDKANQTKKLADMPATGWPVPEAIEPETAARSAALAGETRLVEAPSEAGFVAMAEAVPTSVGAEPTAIEVPTEPAESSDQGVGEPVQSVESIAIEPAAADEPAAPAAAEPAESVESTEPAAADEPADRAGPIQSDDAAEVSEAGDVAPASKSPAVPAASTHVLLAPDAEAGQPAGASLQQVLEGLRALPNDSRLGVARSIASLAYVLDRPIEVVEVGLQGGLLAWSEPFGQGHFTVTSSHACLADASFAPANPSEEVIDGVIAWSTTVLDRHRAMDRLNDLRLVPWGEADGDGAIFRLAAAKAACARLVESTPEMSSRPMPELLVAGGGVFSSLPPSVVALALADLIRRPGVSQLAIDQARILGPLGAIGDEAERRQLLANLADDVLLPLGGLIVPAGIRQGRSAGFLRLKGSGPVSEIDLHPGSVQVVDLPPGRAARADIDFRDSVRLGSRAHHFSIDVGGGLGGLLVDLRDIPMRISDRPDSRRAALDAWQRGMWPEIDE